jgi:Fungal Zn(2)-Cys(6) binuclear cluster domain
MEGIDPRLRDSAPPHYEQTQRQPANYDAAASQAAAYDGLPQSSPITTSAAQTQQHQYYGMPTPGSYSGTQPQEHSGSPYNVQGTQNPSDLTDLKRPRACEACRQLKVRCDSDDHSPNGACRRCAKANRQCIITAPSRKRQKKTDSRVAELERKIDALTATLHAQRGPGLGLGEITIDPAIAQAHMAALEHQRGQLYNQQLWADRRENQGRRESNDLSSPVMAINRTGSKRKFNNEEKTYSPVQKSSEQQVNTTTIPKQPQFGGLCNQMPPAAKEVNDPPYIDVIDRHLIDVTTAYRIFDRYNTDMQIVPVVVFAPGTKAEEVRRSKPVLFLSILSAASNTIRPDLQQTFGSEIMRVLADRVIVGGEKTLEIVQSLQIVTVYYQPPERYDELNFNQLIHIAVVMGIDIGMGKRSRTGQVGPWREYMGRMAYPAPNAAETRRAWLGLYFMCANASMTLRRPLLVRWSAYMDESLEVLANAPDALPSDKWLAHLVRSQHIAEEVGYQFSMDDPPSDVSITQSKVQYQMKTFEKQLDEWRRSSTKDMPQGKMESLH